MCPLQFCPLITLCKPNCLLFLSSFSFLVVYFSLFWKLLNSSFNALCWISSALQGHSFLFKEGKRKRDEWEKKNGAGFAIRCSIVVSKIGVSWGVQLVWKGAIRPLSRRLCGCVFHIFTGLKKTFKKKETEKFCPLPALTCSVLLCY